MRSVRFKEVPESLLRGRSERYGGQGDLLYKIEVRKETRGPGGVIYSIYMGY